MYLQDTNTVDGNFENMRTKNKHKSFESVRLH
jgi:hypothetical protein